MTTPKSDLTRDDLERLHYLYDTAGNLCVVVRAEEGLEFAQIGVGHTWPKAVEDLEDTDVLFEDSGENASEALRWARQSGWISSNDPGVLDVHEVGSAILDKIFSELTTKLRSNSDNDHGEKETTE